MASDKMLGTMATTLIMLMIILIVLLIKITLMTNQISGEHTIGDDKRLDINWAGSYSIANATEPDRKQLVWLYDQEAKSYQFNAIDRVDNHRFYSWLDEKETAGRVNAKYNLITKYDHVKEKVDGTVWTIEFGGDVKMKSRNFDYRQYVYDLNNMTSANPDGVDHTNPDSYFTQENLDNGLYSIEEINDPASAYDAIKHHAGYITNEINLNNGSFYLV